MNWLSALFIFLAMVVYGVIHSWMASLSLKEWLQKRYSRFFARYYRLLYSVFSVISLLPILALVLILPDIPLYRIPAPFVYLSLFVQLICGVFLLLALLQTDIWVFSGLQQAFGRQPRQEGFRADGMYRVVRHPVYSLGLVLLWLLPVMTANTLALILASTLYIFAGAVLEERKLLAQFPEYEAYRRKVPMFIPKLWKNTDTY